MPLFEVIYLLFIEEFDEFWSKIKRKADEANDLLVNSTNGLLPPTTQCKYEKKYLTRKAGDDKWDCEQIGALVRCKKHQ